MTPTPLRHSHRATLERLLRDHLARTTNPRLSALVAQVIRMHRREAALWRTRYRDLQRSITNTEERQP
jgi:hypothetical protein